MELFKQGQEVTKHYRRVALKEFEAYEPMTQETKFKYISLGLTVFSSIVILYNVNYLKQIKETEYSNEVLKAKLSYFNKEDLSIGVWALHHYTDDNGTKTVVYSDNTKATYNDITKVYTLALNELRPYKLTFDSKEELEKRLNSYLKNVKYEDKGVKVGGY